MSNETKHSPEPWRALLNGSGPHAVVSSRRPLRDAVVVGCRYGLASAEDTHRIVACVNACAGIPTEALESGALGKALGLFTLTASGDGQLDALRSLGRIP